ncbi:helix-turn-helix domain-containing protein [Puia dinghuensis]|uniref:AraC family transcriptional regulator n=1 Tax=Puia dinghuensis TaxID=1792502 RepID=A0A8J2UE75_9BACT|nr:AraC family transcriptional regulator [Puia dinghuensis]GGB02920.1 AraC family transcriptional regulator [Puia dinghuensis]
MSSPQRITTDAGSRDSLTWEFDGIRMGHAISTFNTLTSFSATSANTDVVRLHIGLKGNYSFYYKQLDTHYHLIGGHHNILYSKDFDMMVENRTLQLETFGIQFPRETFLRFTQNANPLLQRFADRLISGDSAILSEQWGAVDPGIQQVVHQIVNNPYKGDLQQLFLLSKSIELLVLCAESCRLALDKKEEFLKSPADKEKILAVRDLINERLHCPPNLSQISRTVGLNEYKLKRGFKETFNTTVFGYLAEQRLLLARQYLLDTSRTAAEISYELGYCTPQHFNNAFKKRFGSTPNDLRKNP